MNYDPRIVNEIYRKVKDEIHKVIVGMDNVIEMLFVTLLSGGHMILEGPPGLAKTYLVKAFSLTLDLDFKRIQFTADMLPSDITGSMVYDRTKGSFEFRKGPIFANIVLADEINRAPPRSQSALLEAMQEKQVTIEGNIYKLPSPFMVVATQNPIELEGTYPLPEAELDRFMVRVIVEQPIVEEEVKILEKKNIIGESMDVKKVVSKYEIEKAIEIVKSVYIDPSVMRYIADLVNATRNDERLLLGGSPRASIYLMYASKAVAALRGKEYVTPDHIKLIAPYILNHRLLIKPELLDPSPASSYKLATSVIKDALEKVEVPR